MEENDIKVMSCNVNLNVDKSMLSIGTFSIAFDPDDTYMGRNPLQKPQILHLPKSL